MKKKMIISLLRERRKEKPRNKKECLTVDKSQQYDQKKATQVSLLMKNIE